MKKNVSEKQDIKSKRVKGYFIQATKEIILNEGIENVSVRKVADNAGYTFTTIYNYFNDFNELLYEVKNHMIQDMIQYMDSVTPSQIDNIEDIKKTHHLYLDYYIKRPSIYHFFYTFSIDTKSIVSKDIPEYGEEYLKAYHVFVNKGVIKERDVIVIARTIVYTLYGLLALYFSNNGLSETDVYEELNHTINYLLSENN